jgi:glutamate synthase (NADPH/NADH) small chain
VDVRILDWREVYEEFPRTALQEQAGRCMDCGIPFCHKGCPLGNLIPEWNDLVWRGDTGAAADRLHATNNFPEFTGRLCPAPCEAACVLSIGDDPVSIKQVEVSIIDTAFADGIVGPVFPRTSTGKRVAVVGSGPAGLATAQQLTRAGHEVVVYERADAAGGLLRYGIPEFKMEKSVLDRRLAQMELEGTAFKTGVNVGVDVTAEQLTSEYDAVVLAGGATVGRDLPVPGRELDGVLLAMDYLPHGNRAALDPSYSLPVSAEGKHVVIIGGGDTGADCLGTAHRQGAASVTQLEIMPTPPDARVDERNPWPTWPLVYRTSSAHEEGGERVFAVSTQRFVDDGSGQVRALVLVDVDERFQPVEGSEREIPCDLALLAMGFTGAQREGIVEQLGVDMDARGNVARDASWAASVDGVFVAGDMGRGQSLIVWAIAEGRSCAAAVDAYLEGTTALPAPVRPTDRPL